MNNADQAKLIEEVEALRAQVAKLQAKLEEMDKALGSALEEHQQSRREAQTLWNGARAILAHREFEHAARSLFNAAKELVGAAAGHISVLTPAGTEDVTLLRDPGELAHTLEQSFTGPIRGLREEAYQGGKALYTNDYACSEWAEDVPEGHEAIDNVLLTPLVIDNSVTGLLSLANKPGGFTDSDGQIATACADLIAIALLSHRLSEALDHSDQQFRSVTEITGDAIITIDHQGHIVFWNQGAEAIFGYPAEEVAGKPLTLIMPERYHPIFTDQLEQVVAAGEISAEGKPREFPGLRKDGSTFPLEISLSTWHAGEGLFLTGIGRDITERKQAEEELTKHREHLEGLIEERTAELTAINEQLQEEIAERKKAEEALRESEEHYRDFFENAPFGIFNSTLEGKLIRVNAATARLHGYGSPTEFVETINQAGGVETLYAYPETRTDILKVLFGQEEWHKFENAYRRKDGGLIIANLSMRALRNEDGSVSHIEGIIEDITERKRAEAELERRHRELALLNRVIAAATSTLKAEEILEVACHELALTFDVPQSAAALLNDERTAATVVAEYLAEGHLSGMGAVIPVEGNPSTQYVIEEKKPLAVSDAQRDPRLAPVRDLMRERGTASLLILPLIVRNEVVGTIGVDTTTPREFSEQEIELASGVAAAVGQALHNARLFESEREQRALSEALRDTATALGGTLNLDEVLERILDSIERVVPHDAANIMLIEGDTARVVRCRGYAERGLEEALLALRFPYADFPQMRRLVESGQPVLIADTQRDPHWITIPESDWVRSLVGAPILLKGKVIGVVNIDSATPGFFTAEHAERLQAFADQAAIAIDNARLHATTSKRATRLELIERVGRSTTAILDPEELFQQAAHLISDTFGYYNVNIMLIEGEELISRASTLPAMKPFEGQIRVRVGGEGITGWVAASGEPLLVPDVSQDKRYIYLVEAGRETKSELAVPIKLKDKVIGVLDVQSQALDAFTPEDVSALQTIADQLATAIHNAQLYEQVQNRAAELQELYRVSLNTTYQLDLNSTLEAIAEGCAKLLRVNSAGIYLYRPEEDVIEWTVKVGEELAPPGTRLKRGEGLSGKVWEQGGPLIINSYSEWEGRAPIYEDYGFTAVMGVPIYWGDQFLGVIDVVTNSAERTFSQDDMRLLSLFSMQAATAIQNARLYEQVQRYADELEERVTERTAELQEANEQLRVLTGLKEEFVANVSHELRTPLANLKLYHKLLTLRPEKGESYLVTLNRETDRLEYIIEDLLYLSSLDRERKPLNLSPVDINELASAYVADRVSLAKERKITLTFSKEANLPGVQADPILLERALSELLINALNYTPPGGQIEVHTHSRPEEEKHWVGVSVSDSGLGISPEEQTRLFERFFRGKAGRESGKPGTGLGLAIAQEIIQRHGGRIEVGGDGVPDNAVLSGATFTVWLPAEHRP